MRLAKVVDISCYRWKSGTAGRIREMVAERACVAIRDPEKSNCTTSVDRALRVGWAKPWDGS